MITIGHIVVCWTLVANIIVSKAMLSNNNKKIEKRKRQNDSKILEN